MEKEGKSNRKLKNYCMKNNPTVLKKSDVCWNFIFDSLTLLSNFQSTQKLYTYLVNGHPKNIKTKFLVHQRQRLK